MGNPFVYYRLDSPEELRRGPACAVHDLVWHRDLAVIRRFYARFSDRPVDPDEFDRTVGSPMAVMENGEIVCFAIPLSFREGGDGDRRRRDRSGTAEQGPVQSAHLRNGLRDPERGESRHAGHRAGQPPDEGGGQSGRHEGASGELSRVFRGLDDVFRGRKKTCS